MIIDRFLTYIRAERRYSEHTARNYERDVRRFFAHAGIDEAKFDAQLTTSDDIRRWIVSLSEGGLSAATVNRMTSALRSFFRWLRKTDAITRDPMKNIGSQRLPKRLPSWIAEAKMDEVMEDVGYAPDDDATARRNELVIVFFYSTGMRLAELLDIRISDFSDGMRELRVRGKGGKERVVPLVEYARERVVAYLDEVYGGNICTSPEKHLFLSRKGRPMSRTEAYRIVRDELTRLGVQGKRSPHVLRHTFATHMLDGGADMREIQEMLGHASLGATQVYTHNSIARLREVYRTAHPRGREKEIKN